MFTLSSLSIHTENENGVYQLFGNYVIFSSLCVLVFGNCKQSITVSSFTINVLLTSY